MHNVRIIRQNGFSLMELVVAIVVIGVLGSVFAPYISGAIDSAKATALDRAATDSASYWKLLNQTCSTDATVSTSVLPASGKTVPDVIFGGSANVASGYLNCYKASGLSALSSAAQPGSSAGTYMVKGFAVTFSGGGSSSFKTVVSNVTDSVTLPLARIYSPNISDPLPASDTTSSVVQFSTAASDGTRTVTIIKP